MIYERHAQSNYAGDARSRSADLSSGILFRIMPRQQNLWASSGSGSLKVADRSSASSQRPPDNRPQPTSRQPKPTLADRRGGDIRSSQIDATKLPLNLLLRQDPRVHGARRPAIQAARHIMDGLRYSWQDGDLCRLRFDPNFTGSPQPASYKPSSTRPAAPPES